MDENHLSQDCERLSFKEAKLNLYKFCSYE